MGGEVGDFIPAADYICFFSAFTGEGPGPETTTGLDITTCKFSHVRVQPVLSLDLAAYCSTTGVPPEEVGRITCQSTLHDIT